MMRLATIIKTFQHDFLVQYGEQLSAEHRQALTALANCRTQSSAMMQARCTDCDHRSTVPHSCGHRHCPHCQHHESQLWLEGQRRKQVPAPYFLLTFTLPAELRPIAQAQQRTVYQALMDCAWNTVRKFSQNDRQLQGTPGVDGGANPRKSDGTTTL